MNKNDLFESIGNTDERILERSEINKKKKHRRPFWIAGVAAAVVMVIVGGILLNPGSGITTKPGGNPFVASAYAISEAEYPETVKFPVYESFTDEDGNTDFDGYSEAYDKWYETSWHEDVNADNLNSFWGKGINEFLSSAGNGNIAYSPANVYMALAMLCEVCGGNSRQQILDVLDCDTIDEVRTQAKKIWEACYINDGATTSIPASSVWLNKDVEFKQPVMDTLASQYYASSFSGEMGSEEFNTMLRDWINEQTGDRLTDTTDNLQLDARTVIALVTTLSYRAKWENEFIDALTKESVFHGADSEAETDFMNRSAFDTYYWSEKFGAVSKSLANDAGNMWFILPDEGVSIDEILADSELTSLTLSDAEWENQKSLMIDLSLPKFDISSNIDLIGGLKKLGVTDVFDYNISDFTPMSDQVNEIYVSKAEHGARVTVDEVGVAADAYTVFTTKASSAMPPDEKMSFVLDRPFIFVITSDTGLPLFTGVVNQL